MTPIERLSGIQKQVQEAQQKKARAEGAIEQLMGRMKKEFGCVSIEEAKKKLNSLKMESESARKEFESELERFEEKYGDQL